MVWCRRTKKKKKEKKRKTLPPGEGGAKGADEGIPGADGVYDFLPVRQGGLRCLQTHARVIRFFTDTRGLMLRL